MSTKPHYFRIGLFAILAVVLIVVAVVAFGAGLLARDGLYFESYFAESITGLSEGSPLEFRGVRIGRVERIGFVGSAYELEGEEAVVSRYAPYVYVVSSVARAKLPEFAGEQIEQTLRQMIGRGLRVRVSSNLLTGQAFLEVNYLDPNRFPVEQVPWVPRYLRIPSAPSELTTIKDSVDKILNQLQEIDVAGLADSMERVLVSLDQVISDANVAELSQEARALLAESRQKIAALETEKINEATQELLASLHQSVKDANIPQLSGQARRVLTEAEQKLAALNVEKINRDVERLLTSLNRAVADANIPTRSEEVGHLLAELRGTNEHLRDLLMPPEGMTSRPNLPEVVARLSQTVSQLNRLIATERPEIETILANLRDVLDGLQELVSNLKQRPSELLLSKPPQKSEVIE